MDDMPNVDVVDPKKDTMGRSDMVKAMTHGLGIIVYPDKRLRLHCESVGDDEFDENLKMLAEAMSNVMLGHGGVGISAPQVGIPIRMLIVNLTRKPEDNIAVINPVITKRSDDLIEEKEGCLSFPNVSVLVTRPASITIEAKSFEGHTISLDLKGLGARVVQHEMDHLDGKLLVDHVSKTRREMIIRKLKKMKVRLLRQNGKKKGRSKGPKTPKRKRSKKVGSRRE